MPRRVVSPRPIPAELEEHALRVAQIVDDPNLIPGVHHYCDRWCERCTLTARCLSFQLEQARQAAQTAARRDSVHRLRWSRFTRELTLKLRRLERDLRPTGPPAGPEGAAVSPGWHTTREAIALLRQAERYREIARERLLRLPAALADVQRELQTQSQLGTGDPLATVQSVRDALEVAEWFVFFIEAKLQRATTARAEEAGHMAPDHPSDADGSAKVALIGIDRSAIAWTTLRAHCGREADAILDLLVELERLRRAVERAFPHARSFKRPGFDS